ncbi:Voltage-gated potassium channel subunit beta-1 [Anabarilius grahami]|uniref:Voltage-gated potassium channel subunit beta-1 n=1 Tax=Anabarilius grahami TaxID=495550 RepID=A0A3N0XRG8_ANAGA|nr:Voltage-gated potassium channel subunit beta-1 [Anabarilius grahami]
MYLYKATCPDIPTPKQKGGQKERGQSRCGKQNAGGKLYPPLVCLRSNSQVELKHLEEFLNVHTLSLQDSVRARTGMAYRHLGATTAVTLAHYINSSPIIVSGAHGNFVTYYRQEVFSQNRKQNGR